MCYRSIPAAVLMAAMMLFGCAEKNSLIQSSPSGTWTASLSPTPGQNGDIWLLTITSGHDEVFLQEFFDGIPAETPVAIKWDAEDRLWFHRTSDSYHYTFYEFEDGEWNRCSWDITQSWEFYPPEMD